MHVVVVSGSQRGLDRGRVGLVASVVGVAPMNLVVEGGWRKKVSQSCRTKHPLAVKESFGEIRGQMPAFCTRLLASAVSRVRPLPYPSRPS